MTFIPRTITEITDGMLADKDSRPELAALDFNSQTSVGLNMYQNIAVAINLHETRLSQYEDEIEERATEIPTGTTKWYASESKDFQFGDNLEFIQNEGDRGKLVQYAVEDATKQIVEFSSADVDGNTLTLKVAKDDGTGLATPLVVAEFNAFQDYWVEKRFPGPNINIISQDGDLAIISYRIGVDPALLSPVNGESIPFPGTFPVEEAIVEFLQSFQAENFNSLMLITKLTDSIQTVDGVRNAVPQSVQAKDDIAAYTEILGTENESYLATAGWMKVDPASPLSGTLTYYDFN